MTAASYARVSGANNRIQIGFIGCGLIGLRHIADFKALPNAALTAVCDVYRPRVEHAQALCGGSPKGYTDFRKLLDDKDVDAVVISTPDHWHALATIMACAAGKDVYVEKPMTLFINEGRWMTTAARRYKRICITGTQGRSGTHMKEVQALLAQNYAGKIQNARFSSYRNIMPGFGRPADCAPLPGLDYDLWLGPAPQRPYNPNRVLYHFRWFWDYSGGQMTNLGAHDMDLVHFLMKVTAPKSVYSNGGRYALQDNGETPDVQDAIWEYPGFTVEGSIREASSGRTRGGGRHGEQSGRRAVLRNKGSSRGFPRRLRVCARHADRSRKRDSAVVRAARRAQGAGVPTRSVCASHEGNGRSARANVASRAPFSRLHPVAPAAHLRRGRRPPGLGGLPPGKPLDETRACAEMGRREGRGDRRPRGQHPSRAPVSQTVG